ncbi:hypothetical protein B296_00005982 [Ensete ventricosum]|uniref:Uncharacterized protein n=1 Tax=Ensete ventricosum TaxID=4639 RepID=A0A427ACU4_ENSVE|nr:hypothetical protein B296_00005982 [Ensete ventricosum]
MRRCPVRYAIMRRGMIGATGKLDYFSAYIQLRESDKLEDKAEGGSIDCEERDKCRATNSWAMGWQRHGIAEAELRGVIDPLLLWRESVGRKRGGGGRECRGKLQVPRQGGRAEANELHKTGVDGLLIKIAESEGLRIDAGVLD